MPLLSYAGLKASGRQLVSQLVESSIFKKNSVATF